MIFQNFNRKLFLLLLAAAGMAGCVQEYGGGEIPTPGNGNDVTITVNIPGQQIPTTRSMDGKPEHKVESIDILVFKPDGTLEKHVEGTSINPIEETDQGTGLKTYKVQFKATLPVSTDARTVVIVANAVIPSTVAEGDSKQTILTALTHTSDGKWNTGATPAYIPMYGEAAVDKITSGMKIDDMVLTRMLARIDVVNNATASFKLTDVYVVNHNTKGYIEPKWDGSKPVLNIPTDAYPLSTTATESDALTYSNPSGITSLLGEIYTYEAAATSGIEADPSHTNAICLIVKGKWLEDGKDYYYRIDFTGDNKDLAPDKVPYMPVYRNHLYTFDITAVNGPGYVDFQDALKSFGMLNNLKTKLHVVDQTGVTNMVFNGQHYIGLGNAVTFGYEKDLEVTVPCVTNYWDGWSLDESKGTGGITYESGLGWLTATPGDGEILLTTGSDNAGINTAATDRVAYVHIKAGRLTHQLKVTQTGESFTVTVAPSSLTLPYTAVNGAVAYCLTVSCKDSQGNPANAAWTLTSGDSSWFRMSLDALETFANISETLSGTGTQSVYVYGTENQSTTANRTTTVKLGSTAVVNVTQKFYPPGGNADRITWDKMNQQYVITNDPRDAGLYFKYGSIVGVYSDNGELKIFSSPMTASTDTFDPADLPWNLTDIVATGSSGWETIPHTTTKINITAQYHTVTNVKAGVGDPCRLVGLDLDKIKNTPEGSLRPEEWDNGLWRLPTMQENRVFVGIANEGQTSVHWWRSTDLDNPYMGVPGGEFPYRGAGGGEKFLPATGCRGYDGKIEGQLAYGIYWSNEIGDDNSCPTIRFNYNTCFWKSSGLYFKHVAWPVRCVRQSN